MATFQVVFKITTYESNMKPEFRRLGITETHIADYTFSWYQLNEMLEFLKAYFKIPTEHGVHKFKT